MHIRASLLFLTAAIFVGGTATAQDSHAGHDAMDHSAMDHGDMPMTGALGSYPMAREAAGTSWQPDAAPHGGVHASSGPWSFMGHLTLNGVYDWQGGPRGGERAFAAGMLMGTARRDVGDAGTLTLRAMASPDPFMGKRGYPLLLAAGETADGLNTLVDRQHPHDLFMELGASYSHRFGTRNSVFLYAGLPGQPAFGPPPFMHRTSIADSPEAPLTHHWLDSTHITFGVLTGGLVVGDWKLEGSGFKGREPDEDRYDIESPKLDSAALRLSWNPTENWSLQASWAHLKSPEQLEPADNQDRWSVSAIYAVPFGLEGLWAVTAAWGRKIVDHVAQDALLLEASLKPTDPWTFFARAEWIETDELLSVGGHHGPLTHASRVSAGAVYDWRVAANVKLGIGGLYSLNIPSAFLQPSYGGTRSGAMGFIRLKIE